MTAPAQRLVSAPPAKPLLIWDGDCHFCGIWIERWKVITRGNVEDARSQDVTGRFPEIPPETFRNSVVLIEPDGRVLVGAEAAYRSLRSRLHYRWLSWSYKHVAGFAPASELVYRLIARHRKIASGITRLLWGDDVRPPTYFRTRRWFLRLLGLTYLIAFLSLWVQVDGLVGANGILPVGEFLSVARGAVDHPFLRFPTLCWLNSSNAFLHFLCGGGVVLAVLLICGIAPAGSLAGLFVFYLSLVTAGQTFLSFQWDILLLETGFLAIFFAPWQLWPKRGHEPPVSKTGLFLLKLLLFKLMLMSGVVKLTSGDESWGWQNGWWHWNLATALDFHYWSQPLPTVFAWWADQQPEWFKHFSVAACLVIEIIVPFFIWAPRRVRLTACGLLIFLQIVIAITGNYCFFNLLTIALCFLLVDDRVFPRRRAEGRVPASPAAPELRPPSFRRRLLGELPAAIVLLITLPFNAQLIAQAFNYAPRSAYPLEALYEEIYAFHCVSGYGLFRVMTKDRGEIVVEGSADGIDWVPYEFKWKPGEVKRAPGWCAPHQPRLDWQMWFAALGSPRQNPWFVRFAVCLLQGKHDVLDLLERNPFPAEPPRYLRASFYRYRFTNQEERDQSGAWWKREELGEYLREISRDQIR